MKTRLYAFPLLIGLAVAVVMQAFAAPPPSKADITKLVAQAATYQPGQSREALHRLEVLVHDSSPETRAELEDGLVRLLAPSSTFEAQSFACKQLGIMGSKRALSPLSELLKNDQTAGIACLALTTYPSGKADSILRRALTSARGRARIQIITTLGDRRDAKAVKQLTQLTAEADLSVAGAAIAALGKIADQAAWKAIVARSKDANPALAPAFTEAKLRCAERRAGSGDPKTATAIYEDLLAQSHPVYVRRAALEALLRVNKDQAQQRILQVLHGSDSALKVAAIAGVAALSSKDASAVFAAELPKLAPSEQVCLIASLAILGDAPACTAIGNGLASPNAAVRRAAIDAMGRVGGTWSVGPLARALERSKDADECRALVSVMASLPGGSQTGQAVTLALNKSSDGARAQLISVVARREGSAANPLLLAEAGQSDPAVAKAALRALAKTAGSKEVVPLLERITTTHDTEVLSEAESAAAQALARIDSPARRSAVVREALGWVQGVESHCALLGLLPECGDAAALAALKIAAGDSDTQVRAAAVRALAEWPDASAWDALIAIYRQPGTAAIRELALRGLVRLAGAENAHPSAGLIEHYRQILAGAHSDAEFRLVLGALSGAAQPEALELALPLLDRPGVRAEAEVAVKKIAEAVKKQHPKAAQEALNQLQSKP